MPDSPIKDLFQPQKGDLQAHEIEIGPESRIVQALVTADDEWHVMGGRESKALTYWYHMAVRAHQAVLTVEIGKFADREDQAKEIRNFFYQSAYGTTATLLRSEKDVLDNVHGEK